jgi:lysyl-tRNA synthetase class 2
MGKCWRADERGAHHEPEFTMLEWYRAQAPLSQIADDCEALLRIAAAAAGAGQESRFAAPFSRRTVRELLRELAGVELDGDEPAPVLAAKARAAGAALGTATEWDDVFFQLWLDRVEPRLAALGPLFVFDWPAPLGALARRHPGDPRLVERFELYAGGLELANAFGELTDPAEQRRRFQAETAARAARGKAVYPIDEALLAALPHMPPTAGVALGFDRVMMLALGTAEIRDVIAFADDEI